MNNKKARWRNKKTFLEENGYVVFESVLSQSECESTIQAICDFMEVDSNDRQSWYKEDPINRSGSVPLHHHPQFWRVRQNPEIYEIFKYILDEPELWVTMDRASFKPPCRYDLEQYGADANPLHWDYDFTKMSSPVYQGLIYLTDTSEEQGAFACIPEIYQEIVRSDEQALKEKYHFATNGIFLNEIPEFAAMDERDAIKIAAPQGSLVLFDSRIPHGNVNNHASKPRYVQFLSMFKANCRESVPALLFQNQQERAQCYLDSKPPSWLTGWRGQLDPEPFTPIQLSELGEKLVGLKSW